MSESGTNDFKSEIDVDEVMSDLQSSHSMSSDEQEEQDNCQLRDLIGEIMDNEDEQDSSDTSSVQYSIGSNAKTAVSSTIMQSLQFNQINQASLKLNLNPIFY